MTADPIDPRYLRSQYFDPSFHAPTRTSRLDEEEEENNEEGEKKAKGGPELNFVEKRLLESRTILLSGPVTDKMAKECVARLMVLENTDAKAPVTVIINSPGGSADSGFAIYDILRFVTPEIITVVNGLCASAGILIALAADKKRRFTMPSARYMIHQPSTMSRGTASDLDITAREILKLRDRYNEVISEATGRKADDVLEDARRDFWLGPEEAVEYGLAAKVVTRRADMEG